jgi:hypothetical protein
VIFLRTTFRIPIMPLWFKQIFLRPSNEAFRVLNDHDHEWAEFNLPARSDLQALFSLPAERKRQSDSYTRG